MTTYQTWKEQDRHFQLSPEGKHSGAQEQTQGCVWLQHLLYESHWGFCHSLDSRLGSPGSQGWPCQYVVLRKIFAAPLDAGIQFILPNSTIWVLNGCLFEGK